MKRWLLGGMGLVLLGVAVWSFTGAAETNLPSKDAAAAGKVIAGKTAATDDPLIVHEWGTFTSYSNTDGGRLEFRPLFDDDLPPFVHDRSMGSDYGFLSKVSYRALVRMETPITYFYTKEPRDVRVKVGFPQGLLTEFYPPAAISPPYKGHTEPKKDSSLDWGTVHLIPESYLTPKVADPRVAEVIRKRVVQTLPPLTDHNNHYAYARNTDAAIVHVHQPVGSNKWSAKDQDYFEKFLFYRGLGDFKLPIRVQALGDGKAVVHNSGAEPIAFMMLLDVGENGLRYATFDGVAAGSQREVSLPERTSSVDDLATDLTAALQTTGLYAKEATSMVNTWNSSWFGEQGTRLLYFVPQRLTDELLPLTIDPKPAETVRVLVGRMDMMTPEQEKAVTKIVADSQAARAEAYSVAREQGAPFKYPLPDSVRKLGRLAEPALTHVRHATADLKISDEAASLIRDLHVDAAEAKK